MVDAKHLKLIVAVDQFGSLNKAAKALNVTQSALNHQLRNLEEYLAVAVFTEQETSCDSPKRGEN